MKSNIILIFFFKKEAKALAFSSAKRSGYFKNTPFKSKKLKPLLPPFKPFNSPPPQKKKIQFFKEA